MTTGEDELRQEAKALYCRAALTNDESLREEAGQKLWQATELRRRSMVVGPGRPDENPGPTTMLR